MNLCTLDNPQIFEPMFKHKTRVNKMVNLYSLLESLWQYCVHRGPKRQFLVIRNRRNVCIQMVLTYQRTLLLLSFWAMGGEGGKSPHGDKMKNQRFCSWGNFGDKNHRFHLPAE